MQGNMKILSREFSLLSRRMKDAVMEMKNVRSLAGASMLSALGVVIHAATTVIASLTQMISFAFSHCRRLWTALWPCSNRLHWCYYGHTQIFG